MFISQLSTADKLVLLSLIKMMIAADDVLAPEEAAMLEDVLDEMELERTTEPPALPVEALCQSVTSDSARAYILLELASVAHVDHHFAEKEKELLHCIAECWSIDELTVIRAAMWAESRVKLSREAAEIIQDITSGIGA